MGNSFWDHDIKFASTAVGRGIRSAVPHCWHQLFKLVLMSQWKELIIETSVLRTLKLVHYSTASALSVSLQGPLSIALKQHCKTTIAYTLLVNCCRGCCCDDCSNNCWNTSNIWHQKNLFSPIMYHDSDSLVTAGDGHKMNVIRSIVDIVNISSIQFGTSDSVSLLMCAHYKMHV